MTEGKQRKCHDCPMLLSAPADGRYCNRAHITNGVSVSDVNNGEPRICGISGLPAPRKKLESKDGGRDRHIG